MIDGYITDRLVLKIIHFVVHAFMFCFTRARMCTTETKFCYREPKPRSNFGIGAETFLSETETFLIQKIQIFVMFSHFLGRYRFL